MAYQGSGPATHSLVKALRGVPDFTPLDDRTLLQIVGASTNLAFSAGSVVFEPGSESEALYIVLSGQVAILEAKDGEQAEISRVGPGGSFGEFSMLLRTQHSKTAQALEEAELMIIPRDSFEDVLATNPELAERFQRRLEERRTVRGQVTDSA
jgi:CRP-like cAMP-binding protein